MQLDKFTLFLALGSLISAFFAWRMFRQWQFYVTHPLRHLSRSERRLAARLSLFFTLLALAFLTWLLLR